MIYTIECQNKKGGSLTGNALRELKQNHGIDLLYNKVNEMEEEKEEEEREDDNVEEEIFLDVIKRDAEKLGELINELSQHSKFTDKAMKINTLMDSYFNHEYMKRTLRGGKVLERTKAIEYVDEILKSPLREIETIGLASKIYLLVQKIENTRELIKRLFWIMEIKNDKEKDNELSRTTLNGITDQEYKEFKNELSPESVSRVLKARQEDKK